jgi:hypothetical protein
VSYIRKPNVEGKYLDKVCRLKVAAEAARRTFDQHKSHVNCNTGNVAIRQAEDAERTLRRLVWMWALTLQRKGALR